MNIILSIIGLTGTLGIVLAYWLQSTQKIPNNGALYILLNIFGSIAVGLDAWYHQAWSAFVLQILWIYISWANLRNKVS